MSTAKPEDEESRIVDGLLHGVAPAETSGARTWGEELTATLGQLAQMAVAHGANLNLFMMAAHEAYLQASPELREMIERKHILEQMDRLREQGLLAQA